MFGKNPIAKIEQGDGYTLRVVKGSPFYTIQGEGPFAGYPAIFIRLHGCNLRCWFCDTEFSDPDDPVIDTEDLITKIKSMDFAHRHPLVVITGGEPMRQNILPLCVALVSIGHMVQIETAGTVWVKGLDMLLPRLSIVVSPKTPSIHPKVEEHAIAYKYILDEEMSFSEIGLPITATQPGAKSAPLAAPPTTASSYFSPMDTYDEARNARNRSLVAKHAMIHGGVAGLQMHKFFEVD